METLLDHVIITVKDLDRSNVFDPDGYSLEAAYKKWQHRQS